jgi:hypothetical protein
MLCAIMYYVLVLLRRVILVLANRVVRLETRTTRKSYPRCFIFGANSYFSASRVFASTNETRQNSTDRIAFLNLVATSVQYIHCYLDYCS